MQKKTCSQCGESKDINLFHFRKDSPDGHAHQCAECNRKNSRTGYRNRTGTPVREPLLDFQYQSQP